ncbi:hypothetical protein [Wolbachia endosymbiont of Pentidionis agamae]|uniref:hypothetical protein n=1 Tax=Wolbachia endosymbiont of Pentidionis agamae TaxID=3110435 RepID=UPI002FD670A2
MSDKEKNTSISSNYDKTSSVESSKKNDSNASSNKSFISESTNTESSKITISSEKKNNSIQSNKTSKSETGNVENDSQSYFASNNSASNCSINTITPSGSPTSSQNSSQVNFSNSQAVYSCSTTNPQNSSHINLPNNQNDLNHLGSIENLNKGNLLYFLVLSGKGEKAKSLIESSKQNGCFIKIMRSGFMKSLIMREKYVIELKDSSNDEIVRQIQIRQGISFCIIPVILFGGAFTFWGEYYVEQENHSKVEKTSFIILNHFHFVVIAISSLLGAFHISRDITSNQQQNTFPQQQNQNSSPQQQNSSPQQQNSSPQQQNSSPQQQNQNSSSQQQDQNVSPKKQNASPQEQSASPQQHNNINQVKEALSRITNTTRYVIFSYIPTKLSNVKIQIHEKVNGINIV